MENHNISTRILRLHEVCKLTGLSRSSIYLKVSVSEFPKPIKLGLRSVGWIEAEVAAWIEARINVSRT